MDLLPEVEGEVVSKQSKLSKAVAINASLKTWLIVAIIVIVLGIVAVVSSYTTIKTKIEVKVKESYSKQIDDLQKDLDKTVKKFEDKLSDQKESYEKKISDADKKHEDKIADINDKHVKEIEKKDKAIADLEQEIERLKVLDKISFDEIETDIKSVGKLTTVDYYYTYAGTYEDAKTFFKTGWEMGITRKSFIAQWGGVVAIGVDLSKAKINVNEGTKSITVTLPDAEIFYHDVDEESFEIFDEKNNIFNPITINDKVEFDKKYENKVFAKIAESNMLEKAQEGAEATIKNMLNGIPQVKSQYKIVFQ